VITRFEPISGATRWHPQIIVL